MSHKTLNVHNNNIHDDLSHCFWKGIEDMKTPGISSLWISPIYDVKIRKNKCLLKSAYPSLPSSNLIYIYIYISHTHTHILTKESKLKESSSYFSLWGMGRGRRFLLCGLSQLRTSYLLVGSWFMIFIVTHYYHPLLLPCGTRVVIIEMWPHGPPCGRLLRNVMILEMFMVFACHVTNMPALYISSNASTHFYSFISGFSSNF
jgi:hypothetical protein